MFEEIIKNKEILGAETNLKNALRELEPDLVEMRIHKVKAGAIAYAKSIAVPTSDLTIELEGGINSIALIELTFYFRDGKEKKINIEGWENKKDHLSGPAKKETFARRIREKLTTQEQHEKPKIEEDSQEEEINDELSLSEGEEVLDFSDGILELKINKTAEIEEGGVVRVESDGGNIEISIGEDGEVSYSAEVICSGSDETKQSAYDLYQQNPLHLNTTEDNNVLIEAHQELVKKPGNLASEHLINFDDLPDEVRSAINGVTFLPNGGIQTRRWTNGMNIMNGSLIGKVGGVQLIATEDSIVYGGKIVIREEIETQEEFEGTRISNQKLSIPRGTKVEIVSKKGDITAHDITEASINAKDGIVRIMGSEKQVEITTNQKVILIDCAEGAAIKMRNSSLIEANNVQGLLDIQGEAGELRLLDVDEVKFQNVGGKVDIQRARKVEGGRISGDAIIGSESISLDKVSGNMSIKCDKLDIDKISGNLHSAGTEGDSTLNIKKVSGNATIVDADVQIEKIAGNLHVTNVDGTIKKVSGFVTKNNSDVQVMRN